MNQSVKLSKAVSYIVIICAVLLFAAIWPTEFIEQKYISKSNEIIAMESDPVSVERNVTQMFVAEGGTLSAVDLYVCNDMSDETITFRLYDASYTEIFNTFYVVKSNQTVPGFVHIPVGYDLIKDQEYYFTIEGLSADMTVAYEDRETSTSMVNGFMSYGGIELQRYNVIIRYEYSNPFAWWQILIAGALIAAVTAGLLFAVKKIFEKKITDREVIVQNIFRAVLTPIIIGIGGVLLLMIFPGRKFGTGAVNYLFYGSGILLLMAALLYVVYYKRIDNKPLLVWDEVKGRIPGYLQAFCIAKALWYCYEYMNGLYDIHHSFATRRMIIWFLLGVLCTFGKKELLKWYNLIVLLSAGIYGYFYAKPYFGIEEEGELYTLDAYIITIGIFVLFLLIVSIVSLFMKKTQKQKLCIPYVICLAVFMGLMVGFRNTREWPLLAAGLFGIFYLRMWTWEKSGRILSIVCNGLIYNFVGMVVYSLMHRPYHRYYYYRYGLGFHTVTMTSVYLTLILCALFAKLYQKAVQNARFRDMWLEISLIAAANVYLFLTLSRTGYLAAGIMEAIAVILLGMLREKKRIYAMLQYAGVILVSALLFFPIVFTMTRITPALYNDPILSDVEMTTHAIKQGTPTDSILYADLPRIMKIAGYKVLGMYQDEFSYRDATPESLQEDYFYPALWELVRSQIDPDDIHVVNDAILLANADEDVDGDTLNDMTNGRIDIFKTYIGEWNLTGHEEMGILDHTGEVTVHAHNIFLQVIHDHGLITGIVFILFGVVSFVMAMLRLLKKKDTDLFLTSMVLLAFAAAGMAEWIFHICNPFGISVFFVIAPLLFQYKEINVNE